MATQILAVADTAATSSDVVVAEGEQLTVALKAATGTRVLPNAAVEIQLKDDAGEYFLIETLQGTKTATVIIAAGTYRFVRNAGVVCGVFSA